MLPFAAKRCVTRSNWNSSVNGRDVEIAAETLAMDLMIRYIDEVLLVGIMRLPCSGQGLLNPNQALAGNMIYGP